MRGGITCPFLSISLGSATLDAEYMLFPRWIHATKRQVGTKGEGFFWKSMLWRQCFVLFLVARREK